MSDIREIPQPSLEGGDFKPTTEYAPPIMNTFVQLHADALEKGQAPPVNDWLMLARQAYDSSDTWVSANLRATWAQNIAHSQSRHSAEMNIPPHRAKHFFPKTRTLVKGIKAAVATAFFSNADVLSVEAEDGGDKVQAESAALMRELVNYRLTHTVPWYKIVIGAAQEAAVMGVVISHQSWDYQEEKISSDDTYEYYKVLADTPKVRIVPVENIRISPATDWLDPINASPYLIEMLPMYLCDVQVKIDAGEWLNVGKSTLLSATNSRAEGQSTRNARAGGNKIDPKQSQDENNYDFKIVWVHRNIIRKKNVDYVFYSAGIYALLTEPRPLHEVIPWAKGKRDYVMGSMEIETDVPFPMSPVGAAVGMQKAFNEINNQVYDAGRQVLNPRYLIKAGNSVNKTALMRNTPGGIIDVSGSGSLGEHVTPLNAPNVSNIGFQISDKLTMAFDDLTGSQTGATVQANRKIGETVGGMELMSEGANQIRELELSTLKQTWMEPALQQIIQLIAEYETSETVLLVAARKANVFKVMHEHFKTRLALRVNVGIGAATPSQKLSRIRSAVGTINELVPTSANALNVKEIAKEVFGAAGFQDGDRFFNEATLLKSAAVQQEAALMQNQLMKLQIEAQMEQLKQQKQASQNPPPPQSDAAQLQAQTMSELTKVKAQEAQWKYELATKDQEIRAAQLQIKAEEARAKANLAEIQTRLSREKQDNENTKAKLDNLQQSVAATAALAQNPNLAPAVDKTIASVTGAQQ